MFVPSQEPPGGQGLQDRCPSSAIVCTSSWAHTATSHAYCEAVGSSTPAPSFVRSWSNWGFTRSPCSVMAHLPAAVFSHTMLPCTQGHHGGKSAVAATAKQAHGGCTYNTSDSGCRVVTASLPQQSYSVPWLRATAYVELRDCGTVSCSTVRTRNRATFQDVNLGGTTSSIDSGTASDTNLLPETKQVSGQPACHPTD